MSKYYFSYARPYSGTNDPFRRICGAMHGVFKTACDYRGDFAQVTDQRISTAFFFNGREVIQAMCKSVSSPNAAARVYSRFDEHHDVDCYGEGIENFLENMPEKNRIALDFMLQCAIDSEVGRERIESSPARMTQFKFYMEQLSDSYDLMDTRLSAAEGLYNAEKVDAPDVQQCEDMVLKLSHDVSALASQNLTSGVISDENLLRLCEFKATLNAAQHYIEQYTESHAAYMNLLQQRTRVAKTFLYSHVTSDMGAFGTEAFRDRLYESISDISSDRSIGEIKTVILSHVKGQLGLFLMSIAKAENADKIYAAIKIDATRIATDFFDLNNGHTALRRVKDLGAAHEKITNAVDDVRCRLDGVFLKDNQGRFIISPTIERQRYLRAQDLSIRNDLCADEVRLLATISAGIGLPEWSKNSSPKDRIAADIRIVNMFQQYAAAYKGDEDISPISASLSAKNLARQFGMVVRPCEKNAAQLIVHDRAAQLERFIIR